MPSWVQDPETGKFIPKEEWRDKSSGKLYIQPVMEPFKSPIDGRIIRDRAQLAQHNREHGVTDSRDYSQDHFYKKAKERKAALNGTTREARQQRIEMLQRTIDHYQRK